MDPEALGNFRQKLKEAFPLVNGHPDVAGLFRSFSMLSEMGPALSFCFRDVGITKVVAPEARGPVLGALVAKELNAGLVLVRKGGRNHPGADRQIESAITWRGEKELFLGRSFDLDSTDTVLIVDDWITTGNTIRAVMDLVMASGAECAGVSVVVNKASLSTISDLSVQWLVLFDELVD
jgi:adenine phosphoribosyltransferase